MAYLKGYSTNFKYQNFSLLTEICDDLLLLNKIFELNSLFKHHTAGDTINKVNPN
jgi:hypothetical protein